MVVHLEVGTIRATGAAWTRANADRRIAEIEVKETMMSLKGVREVERSLECKRGTGGTLE